MTDHNPMVEQGQGREPGDDYPGERYDAERDIDRRGDHYSAWWHRQPVPFCHAAALQADTLRDMLRREVARFMPKALPRCAGCGGPIAGFTVGRRYCSIICYRDYEGEI